MLLIWLVGVIVLTLLAKPFDAGYGLVPLVWAAWTIIMLVIKCIMLI